MFHFPLFVYILSLLLARHVLTPKTGILSLTFHILSFRSPKILLPKHLFNPFLDLLISDLCHSDICQGRKLENGNNLCFPNYPISPFLDLICFYPFSVCKAQTPWQDINPHCDGGPCPPSRPHLLPLCLSLTDLLWEAVCNTSSHRFLSGLCFSVQTPPSEVRLPLCLLGDTYLSFRWHSSLQSSPWPHSYSMHLLKAF